jgi:hypothetical protein
LLATKTIAEGKTRETGLLFILAEGGTIFSADRNHPWPGVANVHVSIVCVAKGFKVSSAILDGNPVAGIDSFLTQFETNTEPHDLRANSFLSYQGTKPRGDFCVPNERALSLLSKNPSLRTVLVPYVRGEDVKGQVEPAGTDHIIDFARDPENHPSHYKELFAICEGQVREYRSKQDDERIREFWWLFEYRADDLYQALRGHAEALCIARLSNHWAMTWVRPDCVFSDQVVVFIPTGRWWFAVLQSAFHESWCRRFGKYFKGDFRYNPSDCFYSFPLPDANCIAATERAGDVFFQARREIMQTRQEGLTKTYNRFHDRGEQSADITRLRALHVEMDQAVAAAYGWSDLDLGHGFHATKQGERYTLSEPARRTVLDRLLALNHQRYEEEVKAGLHDKKAKTTRKPKISTPEHGPHELRLDFSQAVAKPKLDAAATALVLIPYLLTEASRTKVSLRMSELKRAFDFVTNPTQMIAAAKPTDRAAVDAWSGNWVSSAGPEWFIKTLRQLAGGTVRATTNEDDPPIALVVSPTQPDLPELREGIRLAVRVARSVGAMPPEERSAFIRERRSIFATV